MDCHRFIAELMPEVSRNATVIDVDERDRDYVVTVAGTTAVIARCVVPRDLVEDAVRDAGARRMVTSMLKRCADDAVAAVPDGRA